MSFDSLCCLPGLPEMALGAVACSPEQGRMHAGHGWGMEEGMVGGMEEEDG